MDSVRGINRQKFSYSLYEDLSAFKYRTPVNTLKISDSVKSQAIHFLFGSSLTDEQYEEICKYIDKQFKKCHTVCMYYTRAQHEKDPFERCDFAKLCDSLGIDPGMKEVFISERGKLLYTHDYSLRPHV